MLGASGASGFLVLLYRKFLQSKNPKLKNGMDAVFQRNPLRG
jgi:hypothetical protein